MEKRQELDNAVKKGAIDKILQPVEEVFQSDGVLPKAEDVIKLLEKAKEARKQGKPPTSLKVHHKVSYRPD